MKKAPCHEFVSLLAAAVRKLDQCPSLLCLCHLVNDNVEADFFENVRHIQVGLLNLSAVSLATCHNAKCYYIADIGCHSAVLLYSWH